MNALAIALCRVSTIGQLKDGNLNPQIERVNKAAEFLEAEIVKRWELAISSRKGKNIKRKDLLEMYHYCRVNKRVKYLIVDEVDRFMRSIDEYYWWKVQLKGIGVQIIHANKPHVNPDDQSAVFDELIDVYRAEQSNNERITKTPEKMMAKMRAGYYTFAPLPGYKTSSVPSLHDVDPERFILLQTALKSVASGAATPNEALNHMTKSGYTTINGNQMDMARFKQVAVKPFYAGIIQVADWGVATENGLQTHMITKQEHESLKLIMSGKQKKFAVNKKNPDFPLNEMLCYDCTQEALPQNKLTGYRNHNGKAQDPSSRHYYKRYRCRSCNTHFTKDELHQKVSKRMDGIELNDDKDVLTNELKQLWHSKVNTNTHKITALQARMHSIDEEQSKMAVALATSDSETIKKAMTVAIEKKEQDKLNVQAEIKTLSDVDGELDKFIAYSINYTEELKTKYWSLDWDRRKRCELLLFPDGFYVTRQKKVYTPRISPIYRYKTNKKESQNMSATLLSVDGGPGGT